jgi:hypothetical protein
MKHFTVEEANAALARVRPLAEAMVAASGRLRSLQGELAEVERASYGNGGTKEAARAEDLREAAGQAASDLSRAVEALKAVGVQVKDLELGLVDFPAHHPQRAETVLLCWRVGEEEIGYWHGLEEGYAGRKPLPF